jgi:hypothetical protein
MPTPSRGRNELLAAEQNSLDSIVDDNVGTIRQSVAGAFLHNAFQGGRAGAAQSIALGRVEAMNLTVPQSEVDRGQQYLPPLAGSLRSARKQ